MRFGAFRNGAMAFAAAALLVGAAGSGSAMAQARHTARRPARQVASGAPLKVGLLGPLSGSFAYVGQWLVHGARAALWEVNAHGGVLGHPLTLVTSDTAGDPVDAVPAWNRLEAEHPEFEIGPTALTIEAVLKLYDPAHLPDFTIAGSTELDYMHDQYVWRTGPSDSTLAKAMAAYAIHRGLKRALVIFNNGVSSETLIGPLEHGYKAHGGKVVETLVITPDQSSYLSELAQAFQKHPNCILMQLGPNTSATVFSNLRELGHLNIPIIDTDNGTNVAVAKAMGFATAAKLLTGMTASTPSGAAFQEFLRAYNAVYHTKKFLPLTPDVYDAVVIAALAMTAAHSLNQTVWNGKVKYISNPPGTPCYTYARCVALLKAHKKINYQGASGPEDFNYYHNTFSGWTVVKWTTKGTLTPVYNVAPAVIAKY